MAATEKRASVLRRQREATRFRILVEIAERQPAVNQREIAGAIGVTAQAVSENVGELIADGHVEKLGRGRYEITKEGVDWLIRRTEELRAFTDHVSEEVVGVVDVAAAIAINPIESGDTVSLSMRDGALHASTGTGSHTGEAVTDADPGEALGVANFEGLLDHQAGSVTILVIPSVADGTASTDGVADRIDARDVLAVSGTEALALARRVDREPELRFGTTEAVRDAAIRGLDVLLIAVEDSVSAHADSLREADLGYEVVELVERDER